MHCGNILKVHPHSFNYVLTLGMGTSHRDLAVSPITVFSTTCLFDDANVLVTGMLLRLEDGCRCLDFEGFRSVLFHR
jgi:hypothetical protein